MTANAKTAALEALIEAHAIELKLPTVRRRFRALAAEAVREQQTPVAYLAALLQAEHQERAERRERRRLIDARFPQIKRLQDFVFADNPNVPQTTIAALAEGCLDRRPRERDLRRRLRHRQDDARDRPGGLRLPARTPRSLHHPRRPRQRTPRSPEPPRTRPRRRPLRPHRARGPRRTGVSRAARRCRQLVFEVLSERHERGSLIVTTNLPFGEWTKVFPDPRLAKAVVDRLTHRAHIIDTGTESWRFRHGLTRKRTPAR
jgi:DNA replication protein DnaC